MLTPQQVQEFSFEKALFGGYDMDSVDEVLEPLTEDYITLYKENSVLKSKMRILVEKLEEYRKQESSMQSAIMAAQKTCDQMLADTEKKCAELLRDAEGTAAKKAANIGIQVEGEEEKLRAAQEATAGFISSMEKRLNRQLELLEELRKAELPHVQPKEEAPAFGKEVPAAQEEKRAFDFDKSPTPPTTEEKADALIEEIGMRIEESLGAEPVPEETMKVSFEEPPAEAPKKKFEDLQFGKNYHIGK